MHVQLKTAVDTPTHHYYADRVLNVEDGVGKWLIEAHGAVKLDGRKIRKQRATNPPVAITPEDNSEQEN